MVTYALPLTIVAPLTLNNGDILDGAGSLTVDGTTLTFAPGATVTLTNASNVLTKIQAINSGSIIAEGTSGSPIVLEANLPADKLKTDYWVGIGLSTGSGTWVHKFQNFTLRNATSGFFEIRDSDSVFENVTIDTSGGIGSAVAVDGVLSFSSVGGKFHGLPGFPNLITNCDSGIRLGGISSGPPDIRFLEISGMGILTEAISQFAPYEGVGVGIVRDVLVKEAVLHLRFKSGNLTFRDVYIQPGPLPSSPAPTIGIPWYKVTNENILDNTAIFEHQGLLWDVTTIGGQVVVEITSILGAVGTVTYSGFNIEQLSGGGIVFFDDTTLSSQMEIKLLGGKANGIKGSTPTILAIEGSAALTIVGGDIGGIDSNGDWGTIGRTMISLLGFDDNGGDINIINTAIKSNGAHKISSPPMTDVFVLQLGGIAGPVTRKFKIQDSQVSVPSAPGTPPSFSLISLVGFNNTNTFSGLTISDITEGQPAAIRYIDMSLSETSITLKNSSIRLRDPSPGAGQSIGIWVGVTGASSSLTMRNTLIRGENQRGLGIVWTAVAINDLNITNSRFEALYAGLFVSSVTGRFFVNSSSIDCCRFDENGRGLSFTRTGNIFGIGPFTIRRSHFLNSTIFGVEMVGSSAADIDAVLNYWNSTDGPSGAGPGTGDPISTFVLFDPFAIEPCRDFGFLMGDIDLYPYIMDSIKVDEILNGAAKMNIEVQNLPLATFGSSRDFLGRWVDFIIGSVVIGRFWIDSATPTWRRTNDVRYSLSGMNGIGRARIRYLPNTVKYNYSTPTDPAQIVRDVIDIINTDVVGLDLKYDSITIPDSGERIIYDARNVSAIDVLQDMRKAIEGSAFWVEGDQWFNFRQARPTTKTLGPTDMIQASVPTDINDTFTRIIYEYASGTKTVSPFPVNIEGISEFGPREIRVQDSAESDDDSAEAKAIARVTQTGTVLEEIDVVLDGETPGDLEDFLLRELVSVSIPLLGITAGPREITRRALEIFPNDILETTLVLNSQEIKVGDFLSAFRSRDI